MDSKKDRWGFDLPIETENEQSLICRAISYAIEEMLLDEEEVHELKRIESFVKHKGM